jgi:hypothetical protein
MNETLKLPGRRPGPRRYWWLLGGVKTGQGIGRVYHFLTLGRTACGTILPVSYGMFVDCSHTAAEQRRRRCPACVKARRELEAKARAR